MRGKLESWTNQDNGATVLNAVVEANGKQLGDHNTGCEIVELLSSSASCVPIK